MIVVFCAAARPIPELFVMSSFQNHLAAAVLGGAALFVAAPAFADARPAWEASCSYKQPSGTFGNGYGIVADACARLRFCQSVVDQGGDPTQAGCFGFVPAPRPVDRRL